MFQPGYQLGNTQNMASFQQQNSILTAKRSFSEPTITDRDLTREHVSSPCGKRGRLERNEAFGKLPTDRKCSLCLSFTTVHAFIQSSTGYSNKHILYSINTDLIISLIQQFVEFLLLWPSPQQNTNRTEQFKNVYLHKIKCLINKWMTDVWR